MTDDSLTTAELAEVLDVKVHTIHCWQSDGSAPDRHWIEGRPYYRAEAIDRWVRDARGGRYVAMWNAYRAAVAA